MKFKSTYDRYMRSPEWYARRKACLKRANGMCQSCLTAKAVHAHHLTYARFQHELPDDLLAVCLPCHEKIHGKVIGRKEPTPKQKRFETKEQRRKERRMRRNQRRQMARLKAEYYAERGIIEMERELDRRLQIEE